MPANVVKSKRDEAAWERAKAIVVKQYGDVKGRWGIVMDLYKKIKGAYDRRGRVTPKRKWKKKLGESDYDLFYEQTVPYFSRSIVRRSLLKEVVDPVIAIRARGLEKYKPEISRTRNFIAALLKAARRRERLLGMSPVKVWHETRDGPRYTWETLGRYEYNRLLKMMS